METSVDGLLVIDQEGIVRFANPAATAFFAGKTKQLVGSQLGSPAIHEPVEIILPGGDGFRYLEMRAATIVWDGHPASLANLRDVTERKRAEETMSKQAEEVRQREELFRSLVEGAPDTIFVVTDLAFAYVNPATCRLFGADSAEQLLKRPLLDRIHPTIHGLLRERIHQVFNAKEPAPPVEQLWLRLDGREFAVEVSSVPITYLGKNSALTFARDITERKKAEDAQKRSRQLAIAAAEAKAANKAKSMFLSTMSHEIRTPMNAILGYSQLMLRDASLGVDAITNLKIIKRSGEHLLSIINNVLDMAKIEAGHLQVTPKTFNLRSHLHDLEAMFRLPANAKELNFEVVAAENCADYITADEGKIRQVLINLLGNAIKFTERGSVTLRVALHERATNEASNQLWLSADVEDTGMGMTPEEQLRLFQPFVQGQAGRKSFHGGTGLGLSISRGVAMAMGGEISVTSQRGSGSVFHFEIPVERAARDFQGLSERRARILGIQPGQDAPKVLIADDMQDNREWLSILLSTLGFSVRTVQNGEAAVQAWEEWEPQLILMDIHMPVMDGLEATRRIRSQGSDVRTVIIALTADAMEAQRAAALASGVDAFISKPCSEDRLLEKIRATLPGLTYIYEEPAPPDSAGAPADRKSDESAADTPLQIPADLISGLRDAIADGDKALLDQLILTIEQRGETRPARALRELADLYQYEKIMEFIDKVCHP